MIECHELLPPFAKDRLLAIVAKGAIDIGVEKESIALLQVSKTVRKIVKLDTNSLSKFFTIGYIHGFKFA